MLYTFLLPVHTAMLDEENKARVTVVGDSLLNGARLAICKWPLLPKKSIKSE